jgi:hypothetical protein
MSAPDVLYLRGDVFYDTTATAWDARTLRPLTPEPTVAPLVHRDDCFVAPWPDLAACCPCTVGQRYARRRIAWETS